LTKPAKQQLIRAVLAAFNGHPPHVSKIPISPVQTVLVAAMLVLGMTL